MPKARIKGKLPIEIVVKADERHHTSVRKPRTHAYRRASEAPVSARAVAVIRPAPTIIALPRSFAPCLANASCTLVGTNLTAAPRRHGDYSLSAGLNRHVVGGESPLQERK